MGSLARQLQAFAQGEAVEAAAAAEAASEAAARTAWWYRAAGAEQGPYSLEMMRQWQVWDRRPPRPAVPRGSSHVGRRRRRQAQGYFKPATEVRLGPAGEGWFELRVCQEICGDGAPPAGHRGAGPASSLDTAVQSW